MLQMGFGRSAFQSGSVTFVASAGALLMKTTAAPILRRFGFRRALAGAATISGAFWRLTDFSRRRRRLRS